MSVKYSMETIAFHLKRILPAGEPLEITEACEGVAEEFDKLAKRVEALGKELAKTKSTARYASQLASCLANGTQPD